VGSKEYPVPNKARGETKSSFRPGHSKGKGLPDRPTTTKRAGHKV